MNDQTTTSGGEQSGNSGKLEPLGKTEELMDKREWQIYKEPGAPCTIFGPLTPGILVIPKSELLRVQGLLSELISILPEIPEDCGEKTHKGFMLDHKDCDAIREFLEKVRGSTQPAHHVTVRPS